LGREVPVVAAADRARFLAASTVAVRAARQAKGHLAFVVGADLVDDDRVKVCERWTLRASLDAFRGERPGEARSAMIRSFHVRAITLEDEG
jgi:quinol monooxygenase YgiN